MTENKKEKIRASSADDDIDDDDDVDDKLPPELKKALDFAWKSEKSPVSYTSMEKLYRELKSKYKDLKRLQVERYLLNDDSFVNTVSQAGQIAEVKVRRPSVFGLILFDIIYYIFDF